MTTTNQIAKIFSDVMEIELDNLNDNIAYNSYAKWDSLRHLQLISELEGELDIEFSIDDVDAMKSFGLVKEITAKYCVEE